MTFPRARHSKKCFKENSELQWIIIKCPLKTKGNGTTSWWHS